MRATILSQVPLTPPHRVSFACKANVQVPTKLPEHLHDKNETICNINFHRRQVVCGKRTAAPPAAPVGSSTAEAAVTKFALESLGRSFPSNAPAATIAPIETIGGCPESGHPSRFRISDSIHMVQSCQVKLQTPARRGQRTARRYEQGDLPSEGLCPRNSSIMLYQLLHFQ